MILIDALKKGQELPDPVPLKVAGVAVSLVSMLLSAGASWALARGWIGQEVSPETIYAVSGTLVSLAMSFIGYVQVATTTRIGVGSGSV